jgi:glycine betaine/proline transport system ATP-binding protein
MTVLDNAAFGLELAKVDKQKRNQRAIVFISHDLDEALRIGDRIAIMEGGRVVQVGAPEEILQNPVDDYVRAFFRGVDPTNVISAGDIVRDTHPTIVKSRAGSLRTTHELLSGSERDHCYVLDTQRRFLGVVSSDSLREALEDGAPDHPLDQAYLKNSTAVKLDASMQDILPTVASSPWPVPVVDDANVFKGVVSKNRFLKTLHRTGEDMNKQTEASAA